MSNHTFRYIFSFVFIVVFAFGAVPTASALTLDEAHVKIQGLLQQIEELKRQLDALRANQLSPQPPVACTTDAMQCPDGSYVGRTGPKCEFKCPKGDNVGDTEAGTRGGASVTPPRHRICKALHRNLTIGTTGEDVRDLQGFLRDKGHLSAEATGYFGRLTSQAVAKWQSSEGISTVGVVGPISRARMIGWCKGVSYSVPVDSRLSPTSIKPIPTSPMRPIPPTSVNPSSQNPIP